MLPSSRSTLTVNVGRFPKHELIKFHSPPCLTARLNKTSNKNFAPLYGGKPTSFRIQVTDSLFTHLSSQSRSFFFFFCVVLNSARIVVPLSRASPLQQCNKLVNSMHLGRRRRSRHQIADNQTVMAAKKEKRRQRRMSATARTSTKRAIGRKKKKRQTKKQRTLKLASS